MDFLKLADGNLAYETSGLSDGDVLLFCHSLGANQCLWDRQIALFEDSHKIVRLDLRGHGQSDVFTAPYSIEMLAKDVLHLLDHLDIRRCSLIGLSLGSMIGLWLAAHEPHRFNQMILAGASASVQKSAPFDQRIARIQEHGLDSMFDELNERWYAPNFVANNSNVVNAVRKMVNATAKVGYIGATMAVRDFDIMDKLSEIDTEMLLITGAEDKATPIAEAEAIAATCVNCKLFVIENASHLAIVEQPELFDTAIVNFINKVPLSV
ncbi:MULTISPECIES: alpha/beta fold hydrolase [Candidatus Puniceispirillum]|jgi:3-oxoadipate enol-lactonase|uniref:3-oxoadipate enol-lactonase II (Beta-ketoadipate enol-lactone hydrolase II) n=1 Tax=Puniceispirillum marinum (strain IMCC1322) TaxID=488538 RepID=D5BUL2_PUNMI|nr:alpha/beta fold hydrolase [Candidatus Puniceispirillum marinum]ADE39959.1 3-oxoadipate enol-lactonase II (Beta-ketoadipate enol-lactone hydrolase II) [Candidatus Puniceispirillum marinum IMCC1322]MBT4237777.1 alpha/beta fold hydrolase [Oceanospirillaceae bacterium]MBT6415903.1 alpha/beta fold hydrolase [Candidatus Puniceispirillum sp.]